VLDEGPPILKLVNSHEVSLNLSTHTGSWDSVMLEGYTEVNCLHGLYLKLQITFHALRTNFSYEPWLTFSYTLFVSDGLT
jgi:hypothetical protein